MELPSFMRRRQKNRMMAVLSNIEPDNPTEVKPDVCKESRGYTAIECKECGAITRPSGMITHKKSCPSKGKKK